MRWPRNMALEAAQRREERLGPAGSDLDRKYWIALVL